MAGKFNRLAYFFPTYASMLNDFRRQKRFMHRHIEAELMDFAAKNDGSLDEEDFNKILKYYGFGVPAIVGEGFCVLRGRRMTARERMASTCQGVITGLFDDFFDKTNISREQVREMMCKPFDFVPGSSLEWLFIRFLRKVHQHAHDISALNTAFDRVYMVQLGSQLQKGTGIGNDKLLALTMDKGGFSLLFYRSVFSHPLADGEYDAVYQVGGLMQLANDLFDVYQDSRQGIRTLITHAPEVRHFRSVYQDQLGRAFGAIKGLACPERNKSLYLRRLSLGISRCMVCLDQLEKLEHSNKGAFDPRQFNRADLICDMEKWGNRFRSLFHYLRTDL